MDTKKTEYKIKHLTVDDIKTGCVTLYGDNDEETKLCIIQEEFRQGIETLTDLTPSVTFYGSSRIPEESPSYEQVRHLAYRISQELGYAVISGGGGGLMEAANRGAYDANGKSVGLTIRLPHEQKTNPYVNDEIPFYFFFTRQVSMSYTTEVCIFAHTPADTQDRSGADNPVRYFILETTRCTCEKPPNRYIQNSGRTR